MYGLNHWGPWRCESTVFHKGTEHNMSVRIGHFERGCGVGCE